MPAGASRVDQLRREALHPPEQRHMVRLDTALGEELFQVPVGQSVAQVPADRQQDHVRRKPEPGERQRCLNGRPRAAVALHPVTLTVSRRSIKATLPSHVTRTTNGQNEAIKVNAPRMAVIIVVGTSLS